MHKEAFIEMGRLLKEFAPGGDLKVAELGSWTYGGREASLRLHAKPNWSYIGLDIRGKAENNVDIVMPAPYEIPFPGYHFDMMISSSTLEHVKNPWRLAQEIARVMKQGGIVIFQAPFVWPLHDKFDGYRFAPKGMRALFADVGIVRLTSYLVEHSTYTSAYLTDRQHGVEARVSDCWFVGKKT